jgi:hypothetical protein
VTSNQGLRRVLIKKLTIIARKPTEIGEAALHCDLRNVCHHRVAASQDLVRRAQSFATKERHWPQADAIVKRPMQRSSRNVERTADFRNVERPRLVRLEIVFDLVDNAQG